MSKYKNNSGRRAAAALKYSPGQDSAPVVVASGHGEIAKRIISVAEENGVAVYRDDSASAMLTMLEVGRPIPPELFSAVAAIYIEILKLSDALPPK